MYCAKNRSKYDVQSCSVTVEICHFKSLHLHIHTSFNLAGSRDQRRPGRDQTVEVGRRALGRGPALQAQNQRVNPALPGAPASRGDSPGRVPETKLEADTRPTRLSGKSPNRNLQ